MAFSIFKHLDRNQTPQTEPIPGRETQMVRNSNAGYSFAVDDWTRLERFLILGSEGGSYYASERALTRENAAVVERCLASDLARTVATIEAVSESGRAPKNDPAILALAITAGSGHTAEAAAALPKVCRTGTHLFQFAEAVQALRGWGRGMRKGVAAWYERLDPPTLAYQVAKYPQREGWSHRDLLRLAHPVTDNPSRQAIYRWVVGGRASLSERALKRGEAMASYPDVSAALPRLLAAVDEARSADRAGIIRLIREDHLPRECIPTQHLNDPNVWEALLEEMPLTAMIRNLAKMTTVELLKPLSSATATVCRRLGDSAYIRKARVHPLAILLAGSTYSRGHGLKGKLKWTPVPALVDALDGAFDLAFANVEPTGRRLFLALDVSGSMGGSFLSGTSISAREASAAMGVVTARTEPHYHISAFTASKSGFGGQWGGGDPTLTPIPIGKRSRLAETMAAAAALEMGGTDCSLPMRNAIQQKLEVDTFVIYTDSETWAGPIHPIQALRQYRDKTGIAAKLIVVGMVSNGFSIADPDDAGMLDVVGFDASAPAVMADFARA
jgi:60 kDa SS-A/Ro ribonucleoprotein